MNETSCFSPRPSPYRCHLFPWQQCFWWRCGYRSNISIAWVPGGGRARLQQPVPFFYSVVFLSPQIGLASFTSVPIAREEEKWRFAHDLGLGEEGRIQRQAQKRMRAAAERLASCQVPGNLFSYPTDYSRNVRSY